MYKIANLFAASIAIALCVFLATMFACAGLDQPAGETSRDGVLGTWTTGAATTPAAVATVELASVER